MMTSLAESRTHPQVRAGRGNAEAAMASDLSISVACPYCGGEISPYAFTLADPNNSTSPRTGKCPTCDRWSMLTDKHGVKAIRTTTADVDLTARPGVQDPILDLDALIKRPKRSIRHLLGRH